MSKYLVTGGTGFLGSFIVKNLIFNGYKPILLLRESSSISRIAELVDFCKIIRYGHISIEEHFKTEKPDVVIHTACNYGREVRNISSIIEDNILFGVKVFEACLKNGIKVFANIDSTLPKELNVYSLSKYQFKELLKIHSTEIKVLNFRLDHMYGENDDKNKFIYWFIDRCLNDKDLIELTDGSQKRDFIHVNDVSSAIINVIECNDSHEKFINLDLGTGKLISMKDFILLLAKIVEEVHGVDVTKRLAWGKLRLRKKDFKYPEMDIHWLNDYKCQPKTRLEEGLIKIVEKFK